MKTFLLYAVASHKASVLNEKKIIEVLNSAKENGFERVIIIKKSQMVAKTKELKRMFDVDVYPKTSIAKAMNNSNACMLINDGLKRNRKKKIVEEIEQIGAIKMKFMLCITI
jgi:hypothetical protein